MIDPAASALNALTSPSPAAIGVVFAAGVMTSVGPCVAPRYVAVAALAGGRKPLVATLTFVSGLIAALAALGLGAGLLGSLWSITSLLYAALAAGLIGGGGILLVRAVPHSHAVDECCAARRPSRVRSSLGGIFLLGAASAFVVSPCCTPVIAAIVATSTAIGQPALGALLLASYALGHAVPLFFAGRIGALMKCLPHRFAAQVPQIVSAVLLIALGAYYGVLA